MQLIFGRNQLVICGDLFDRGKYVTEELWLLYKLETAAAVNGGEVHVLLGNHDIMNMGGDWRYVNPVYATYAKLLDKSYGELFDNNTELGKWLRSKNVIERIGNYLCLHGGFSREMLDFQLSVKDLNSTIRPLYSLQDSLPQDRDVFFGDNALFWYRGYFFPPLAPESLIDSTLDFYNVRKIIVGHTIHNNVASYYDGKVIGIDTDWRFW
ncbi:MAG: metallophosphoesterase [Chitinophagaceae bacterium]